MNYPLMRSMVLGVYKRIENPVFGIGACAGGVVGVYTGMIDGLSEARQEDNGYLWRPVLSMCGRSFFLAGAGLFWPECLTIAVGIDMIRSFRASQSQRHVKNGNDRIRGEDEG